MKLKLVKKVEEGPGTKSFFWEPEKPISFEAGQYYYYTLPKLNYPDDRGATRQFTISASPTEGNLLRLTTRFPNPMSGFKKTLDKLPIGSEVDGDGPQGVFILTKDEPPTNIHVYIAGGIGITPFRSMIKFNIDKNLKIPTYLIYSNSDNNYTFKNDLDEWQAGNDFIKINYFNSKISGHLDDLKIREIVENWLAPGGAKLEIGKSIFSVVGPPPFVTGVEEALNKLKISGGKILTEKFTGY